MGVTSASDAAEKRSPRRDTRDSSAHTSSRRKDRSSSASSRSDRSRSRSRSRERSSRSRRSRSPTSRRKPHSSSRRSHRSSRRSRHSRSRSTSRDRRRDGHRSRRSHRSVSRSRSRGRHGDSSSRKRRHRDRSRSTERRRGSGDGIDLAQRDRRRQRRDSSAKDAKPKADPPHPPAPVANASSVEEKRDMPPSTSVQSVEEKSEDATPTSQESVATTTGAMTASSQSDAELTKSQEATAISSNKTETKKGDQKTGPGAAKVDVRSIKMDILKALADARSAIAGIKGSAEAASAAENSEEKATASSAGSLTQEIQEENEKVGADKISVISKPSTLQPVLQPVVVTPTIKAKSVSPRKTEIAAADVDEFDIFSAADRLGSGLPLSPVAVGAAPAVVDAAIQSNYDDAEGYYKPSIGEVLNGKYRVMGTVGKGVFSTVLRCQCLDASGQSSHDELDIVAIKLIRSNEVMREASQTEIRILTELSERDPRDKKHCVRLLERFEHRNHVALVFEPMQMNVREAMKKFGGKGGISIQAVRIFCKHLLVALTHLESCNVVHADIKPDNVLLDEKQSMIKLCDFGSAFKMHEGNHDPTPYLVSRFYRAPEIVLGLPYDKAVDMWSVGCCLYEMFTGKVMFPGSTNNEMLKLFMELKGKVPNKIIKKHRQAYIDQFQMEPHFTEDNKFVSHEVDRVTNKPIRRHLDAIKTRFDLGGALVGAKSSTDDRKQVLELRNLLERMFTLDPAKRITPKEALAHPFVKTEATKP